jgi:hypothetical protein
MKPNESLVSDAARPVSNQALERRLTFRSESGARFANGACRSLRSLLVSALCIRLVPAVPKGVASKKKDSSNLPIELQTPLELKVRQVASVAS